MHNFSVVIPIFNEQENIIKLIEEIKFFLKSYKYELIIVDDASSDNSLKVIEDLSKKINLKVLKNKKNKGQSYSITKAIKNSIYNIIVSIDGDGQNNPKDIPKLLEIYFENNYKLVGGIRHKRKDNLIKIISSRVANFIRIIVLRDDCIDTGCSLKVFDKNIFLTFPYFDGIHRFLPALFKGFGYNTKFINVDHRSRVAGKSKYGTLIRLYRGVRDLFIVFNIIKKHND